jgi:NAD(P)-dependent dehydrogenase (short-subunit alcohol dehydrogenase family)
MKKDKNVIVITGASSGFGALAARALARAGHTVYASMRETTGRNAPQVAEAQTDAADHGVDLRTIELDVASEASAAAAIEQIIAAHGRLDVVIHNAGHMVFGPAEAFTPEQLAELYDVNVLSTQRVNRAALPQLRKQRRGLVIWVSSSSSAGGTPPYLAPYFAAKAGMDALAVVYARELTRWGIETSILVPGAFTGGTNHFAHAGSPADKARAAEYEAGPMRVSPTRCARASPPSCRPMRMSRRLPRPSSGWSRPPSAGDRSGYTLTRRKTARRSSTPSRIVSAPSCFVGLVSAIC